MKLKLLHKLFLGNLGIILVLVLGLLASSYYSSKSFFNDSINNMEIEAAQVIANGLAKYYEKGNSWNDFVIQRKLWHSTVTSLLMDSALMPVALSKKIDSNGSKLPVKMFIARAIHLMERISLLDTEKVPLIQPTITSEKYIFQAITHNGVNIAWLRIGLLDF